jgi:NADH:ubiquinone oxidoreductase subunit 5 (subunit L)/multisubunit Na+/H+ antiporter MnhA subunit
MGNLWLKIKVWFKVALVAALILYVIVFTAKNSSKTAQFWYWYNHTLDTTLLVLVLCSFLAGVVGSLLFRTMFRTVHQLQELKERSRTQRIDRQVADIHSKAAMLQTRPSGGQPPSGDASGTQNQA